MRVTIPASIEDATAALGGLDRLLKAKEWERAAIVAAFVVMPGTGRGGKVRSHLSANQFAALGIAGLKDPLTVRQHVRAWESTGRPRPVPGEAIDLAGLPEWQGPGVTTQDNVRRNPKQTGLALADPDFMASVVDKADEATRRNIAAAVADVISANADFRDAAAAAIIEHGESEDGGIPRLPRDPKPRDYGRLIESAVNNLSMSLAAANSGRYELTSRDEALLYFVTMLLGERLAPEGDLVELVESKLNANMDEIERYANAGGTR